MTVTIRSRITGGVDTHLDTHVAAALDERGALLGVESFETTPAGYAELLEWMRSFGEVELVGVEGTGSYGAGLTRVLHRGGIAVVEVDRPNRQRRRSRGKSDPQDAVSAARAAQSGDCTGQAKTRDGNVETMRVLRIARNSARRSRTQALNQMRSIISTAPDDIRGELRDLNVHRMLNKASAFRPRDRHGVAGGTKWVLRTLARRAIALETEVKEIDQILKDLVEVTAPELVARSGLGTDTTSALLVAAGDNPQRLRSEASFAHLCGVAPIDANTGKQQRRHRLNRGGDRQANSALWHIVITRMACDQTTRDYINRRTTEGLTKKEAIRCLKRHISREVYHHLPRPNTPLDNP
jgi:transposase